MTLIASPMRLCRHSSTANSYIQTVRKPQLSNSFHLDEVTSSRILDAHPDIKTLEKLHSKIIFDPGLCCNTSLAIKLMRAYAACGQPNISRQLFDKIPDRNVVVYNVMIRSYANNRFYQDAIFVYKDMCKRDVSPDNFTFPCVLKACFGSDNLKVGLQIHCTVSKRGLDSDLFIGNCLVAMYGKCGCLVEARQVLNGMPKRDVVSWNSMVVGYAQNGMFDDALEVCKEMNLLGHKPNAGTMASILPAVSNTSIENVSFVKDIFLNIDKKDSVPWNVMIAVYVKNSMPNEAVELYLQMETCGIEPDAITFASILPACGDLSAASLGRRIHESVERKGLRPNLSLENSLVDMYARCGYLTEARKMFEGMKFRDVVSWTSLISAYGKGGQGRDGVALFSKMLESGLQPDSIAFVSVLSACSHAGLLQEGEYYYRLMTDKYKIVPRLEHYACMVDLKGRAGCISEAYNYVKQMPMEANERIWGALLGACRLYNDMDIGLVAADNLFELSPKQSGYYVLLSNIYAKAGRWEDVTTVRSIMKGRGIKKMPGISNVEINNMVHTFLAGDTSHPQSKKIYEELDIVIGKMKEEGYVPETNAALHDVEEEDKENHLVVHSEKLAIVFAIMNTTPDTPIRITKNLRVCGDCHIAAKIISKITQRLIIVRDTNRYHHFQNGVCSCSDYW
ncbi:putative pentatricopeptide repeat-containing protein At3g49142 [Nicotiana tomentosiformis]|uniref:putative pentatricopeptide repeat-containing protein At3g49142 n=1 Tax=Nicotiana tomentosiformis TaxID=4098 RepID=UPI00051BF890|nr:putative pentatricopeptide repeat-containing protein At3g49142 [Nicotiana tomentosiformis]